MQEATMEKTRQRSIIDRQLMGHLVLGPFVRRGWSIVPLLLLLMVVSVAVLVKIQTGWIAIAFTLFTYTNGIYLLRKVTRTRQAVGMWWVCKCVSGLIALIFVTVAPFNSFSQHNSNWWMWLVLGLVIMPGLEFIPRLVPYQRYVTLCRIILFLPLLYFIIERVH